MYLKNNSARCIALSIIVIYLNVYAYASMVALTQLSMNDNTEERVLNSTKYITLSDFTREVKLGIRVPAKPVYITIDPNIGMPKKRTIKRKKHDVKRKKRYMQRGYLSEHDIHLLERVTMSEASIEPFEVKVAVAQTVLNRFYSGKYGKSIDAVVYSKHQFSTSNNGKPNKHVIAAVRKAIYERPYPSNMLYFREDYYHRFAIGYRKIGAMYFSLAK